MNIIGLSVNTIGILVNTIGISASNYDFDSLHRGHDLIEELYSLDTASMRPEFHSPWSTISDITQSTHEAWNYSGQYSPDHAQDGQKVVVESLEAHQAGAFNAPNHSIIGTSSERLCLILLRRS